MIFTACEEGIEDEAPVFVVEGAEDIVGSEDGVVVGKNGGEIVLELSTNIDYTINIPVEAQSWLSVVDTRAVENVTLTITAEKNETGKDRSATVQILDGEGNELLSITITQEGIDEQEAIVSQDQEVKRLCVENWDTNDDGELSYGEAMAVTDIGEIFSQSSISTFDELKYFTSLESLNIAFYNCASLTNVTIPDSVTTIGRSAFWACTSLKSVYCKATTPPDTGWYMFYDNASGRKIYVPMASVDTYKAAKGWKDYATDIVGYNF